MLCSLTYCQFVGMFITYKMHLRQANKNADFMQFDCTSATKQYQIGELNSKIVKQLYNSIDLIAIHAPIRSDLSE